MDNRESLGLASSSLGRVAVAAAALLACVMCIHGETTVVEPAAKGPSDTLALTIVPDGGEAAAAAALGWTAGIPGAEVILAPSAEPKGWGAGDTATGPPLDTLKTDSAGHVSIANLAPGWYYVEVRRWLTDSERVRLSPGTDLIGFMTQQTVERGPVTLFLPGSHRRSIVISEVSNFYQWLGGNSSDSYTLGGYVELANNADTTVYLDGLAIGLFGVALEGSPPDPATCAGSATYVNDPNGVWVSAMDSLPGTGRDYPLAPGGVALIATNAIDHRPLSPVWGQDLSHANFECIGSADADNPGVPNCIGLPVGTNPTWAAPHGMIFSYDLASAVVVALPVDTASLPKVQWFTAQFGWIARIPRDRILDMLGAFWSHLITPVNELCPIFVNRAFDGQPAPLFWTELPDGDWHDLGAYSIQRKVAFTRPDGRKLLQDTRSTEADFFVGLRTPFQLP
jgi:hypothetical protein